MSRSVDYLITGVSSGLGKAMAMELLDRNFSVLGVARTNAIELNNFSHYSFCPVDLSSPLETEDFLHRYQFENAPKAIILNAALLQNDSIGEKFHPEIFQKVLAVNLNANLAFLSHFLPLFRERGSGSICAISSQSVIRNPGQYGLAYATSKAGITSVMEAFRLDPANRALSFTTAFPAALGDENRWPLYSSYTTAARRIISGIQTKKETVYIPRWKHLLSLFSKLIPDRYWGRLIHFRFKAQTQPWC